MVRPADACMLDDVALTLSVLPTTELLEEAGIRTSSDEATIAAAALGEARASGEGLLGADEPLLGSDAAAAPAAGVTDAVAAAAVRMATRMAMARLMR